MKHIINRVRSISVNKEIKKILIVLGLYAFAGGFLYNFQELWMQENNLSVTTIGTVFSICSIVSVSIIFLFSNLIRENKLKTFELVLIALKTITLLMLFLLNGTGLNVLIKFLIMLDYVIDVEIYACIYPMLALINKNDKLYARRGLIYDGLYYTAVLISGVILGKAFYSFTINYNFYVIIACLIMLLSFIILKTTNLEQYYKKDVQKIEYNILTKLLKDIKNDKISIFYILNLATNQISYYSLMGLKVIMLSEFFSFSPKAISIYNIVVGISAVLIGVLIMEKLTLKNDYINVGIKFGGRVILYFISVITSNKIIFFLTLLYSLLLSSAYTHISDAPFVNRFEGKYQLAFCNLKEMVGYFGRAIGTFLCGIGIAINVKMNFIFACAFAIVQLICLYVAIYLRKKVAINDRK